MDYAIYLDYIDQLCDLWGPHNRSMIIYIKKKLIGGYPFFFGFCNLYKKFEKISLIIRKIDSCVVYSLMNTPNGHSKWFTKFFGP